MPDDPNAPQGIPPLDPQRPALDSTRLNNSDRNAELSFDEPNLTNIGRYQILERLGKGGFGLVYRAEDQRLARQVAIKLLTRFQSSDQIDLWLQEARMLARLDHPAIVPVYDADKTDSGIPFIVSKLIEGGSLEHRLQSGGWGIEDSVRMATQLARALDYLHSQGVIHRDVKPANILTTLEGNAVLADFGLAMPESAYGRGARFVGTPAYMSPEQARHEGHRVDGRSDIYSLGVVFYELLTGKRPFQVVDREQLLDCIRNVEARPVRQLRPSVPRELERICMKALAKKISDRYGSAADMAEDLQQWKLASTSQSPSLPALAPETDTLPHPSPLSNSAKSIDLDGVAVIPHGLRSFDANDADFFRFLVPGPRDRDGVPEAIRFWTKRIASRKSDEAFHVGVLMGPSGSGKSSLIRAGVLPLVERDVDVVYIEAKPVLLDEVIARQIRQLGNHSPEPNADPRDPSRMLSRMREGGGTRGGKKLLMVIDQFEQWLNHHRAGTVNPLLEMLRQCDGVHVQALLIVRDDFVLGLSSFMDELEEPMQQNKNFATVDTFSAAHARQVLAAFGRAYGAIRDPITPAQSSFIDEAVAGLQAQGPINPVQLALLSDMTKGKSWSPTTLRDLGGIRGLGIAFLDEKLTGASAHPVLRTHPESVRLLLAEFLPHDNTVIKPPAIQESQLAQNLQYSIPAETVRKILQLLDTELRLITPTSSSPTSQKSSTGSSVGDPAYQLAHDYLVPTTREWLALHQSETRAGRVREQLREIANAWSAKPSNKRLPSFPEWLSIRWFTSSSRWTESERQMMQRSDRRIARNALLSIVGIGLVAALSLWTLGSTYTASLAQGLRQADSGQVVEVLEELDRFRSSWLRHFASPPALTLTAEDEASARAKLHLALARVDESPEQTEYVRDHLHEVESRYLGPMIRYLTRKKISDEKSLVENFQRSVDEGQPRALPLSALLAQRAPANPVWREIGSRVDSLLLNKPATEFGYWSELFMPVASHLVPGLLEKGKQYRRNNDPLAETCRSMVQRFAAEDHAALADAMTWSQVEGIRGLVDSAASKDVQDKLAIEIRDRLTRLNLPPYPPALPSAALPSGTPGSTLHSNSDPSNSSLPCEKANAMCTTYGGMVHGRGGWMDRVPLADIASLIDQMRPLGYRPLSIRPFVSQSSQDAAERASVTWILSDEPFETLLDVARIEVEEEFEKRKREGWSMVDFASLPRTRERSDRGIESDAEELRWWGVWRKRQAGEIEDQSLALNAESQTPPVRGGRVIHRWNVRVLPDGELRVDLLFTGITKAMRDALDSRADDYFAWYFMAIEAGDKYPGIPCSDIRARNLGSLRDRGRFLEEIAFYRNPRPNESALDLAKRQASLAATLLDVGKSEAAMDILDQVDVVALKSSQDRNAAGVQNIWRRTKATGLAKLSRTEELRQWIVDEIEPSSIVEHDKILLRLRLALLEEDRDQSVAMLSALEPLTISNVPPRDRMLRAWALVASKPWGREAVPGLIDHLCSRAKQWQAKNAELHECLFSSDFDGLQTDPTWKVWSINNRLAARITSSGWMRLGVVTQVDYGVKESEFRRVAASRLEQGYVPTALESTADSDGKPRYWCLWEKDEKPLVDKARRAREIANLAVGLTILGQPDALQSGLREFWGRSVRTALIEGATRAVDPRMLVQWLQAESSPSMQAAYLEILGGIPLTAMDASSQSYLAARARDLAQHSAEVRLSNTARWCCSMWQLPIATLPIDQPRDPSRNWFTNSLGQQFAVIDVPEQVECGKLGLNRMWKKVDRRIAIATTETTGAVFETFLADPKVQAWVRQDPRRRAIDADSPEDPQRKISWNLAVRFCQWLNEREGIPEDQWCYLKVWEPAPNAFEFASNYLQRTGYRLPTYAEWKHVCAGATDEAWHFGSDAAMISFYEWTMPHSNNQRQSAARKRPNAWGVFDIAGSLSEWCDDVSDQPLREAWRPFNLDNGNRMKEVSKDDYLVLAGGRFKSPADLATTDSMGLESPNYLSVSTGFRVARTLSDDGIRRPPSPP
jgi:serine/threonine protein kinase/formylglycine-generating enzyme required for sulfatase activity